MKTVGMKMPAMLAVMLSAFFLQVTAQQAKYSDTGFVNNAIKQHIIEFKLAEKALTDAKHPRVKQLAREVMRSDREALTQLLPKNMSQHVEGVSQQELDAVLKSVDSQQIRSNKDDLPEGITGNTPNENLGSSSSGSGNVHGQDTGTIARTQAKKNEGSNYSADGDYAYNNNSFLADVETLGKSTGETFETQWLDITMKMQTAKINKLTMAIDASKDDNVRAAALALLPKARLLKDYTMRIIKNRGASRSVNPESEKTPQDDQNNSK